jgi:mRNA interferase HigB
MNVISRPAIREAQLAHPRCRAWLEEWWRTAKREQWTSLHDIRQTYASADQVGGRYLVFDAPEGKRLIVGVRYAHDDPPAGGTLFVKHFLTHDDYNRGTWKRS